MLTADLNSILTIHCIIVMCAPLQTHNLKMLIIPACPTGDNERVKESLELSKPLGWSCGSYLATKCPIIALNGLCQIQTIYQFNYSTKAYENPSWAKPIDFSILPPRAKPLLPWRVGLRIPAIDLEAGHCIYRFWRTTIRDFLDKRFWRQASSSQVFKKCCKISNLRESVLKILVERLDVACRIHPTSSDSSKCRTKCASLKAQVGRCWKHANATVHTDNDENVYNCESKLQVASCSSSDGSSWTTVLASRSSLCYPRHLTWCL